MPCPTWTNARTARLVVVGTRLAADSAAVGAPLRQPGCRVASRRAGRPLGNPAQRQTYNLLIQVAQEQGSQIIAASHSEVVLNEAAGRDAVIAFVGKPHRIDDGNSQVVKSLRDIGFDHYYQAQEMGWVLYLENSTDLAILQAFARLLDHKAQQCLERPFVKYVETNLPQKAREHFFGLQEAKDDLVGIAIFDRLDRDLQSHPALKELMWRRREIENYFCTEEVLVAYAVRDLPDDLFGIAERTSAGKPCERRLPR